jgi:hypothetical protein
MFYAGGGEACFLHPSGAIGSRVIEAAGRLYQHVQTHQQAECVLPAVIVDEGFVDDYRAEGPVQGFVATYDPVILLFAIGI